ncbi:MAG TPA: flagellar hook capping FlgD N-terminal domain-containing protein [Acidimicrobiales bacterium]
MPETAPIHYVLGSTSTNTPAERAPTNELDKEAFLKLLVAQLRYQNPMSPADPQSFLAQTAQFTTVEQLTQLTKQLAEQDRMAQVATGSSLVGRVVTYQLDDGTVLTGKVTAARPTADGCVVVVGDMDVPLDAITTVY